MKGTVDTDQARELNLSLFPYTTADGKHMVRICRGVVGLANVNDFEVSSWLQAEAANVRHRAATSSR